MARKRPPEPDESEGEGKTKRYSITIDPDLVRKIRMLAAADDVSPPDWVNNHLRKIVRETWRSTMTEIGDE